MSVEKSKDGERAPVRTPSHPVPQLQKPFEESMSESINDDIAENVPTDATVRRTMLLEAPTYERVIAGRWKQKPGEKYHPLWKLVAQLTFGMHLLSHNMAISEDEVMRILQSHVDDIDAFLERTTEDFDLAQSDIHERIRCLKLPLAYGDVFDRMLEDRGFRASILEGNEKIDHVIGRTKKASKDALKDVQKGFDATNVMEKYLSSLSSSWKRGSPEHEAVLVAMQGNVEGWRRAFLELHLEGNKLAGSLKKLAEVVSEMQHRAAMVSRNLVAKAQKTKHITTQAGRAPSMLGLAAEEKPLPTEPGKRRSSRNSSRSTQLTTYSSRPESGKKSNQGLISQTQSTTHQSPQSAPSVSAENAVRALSSGSIASSDALYHSSDRMLSLGGLLIQTGDDRPIELPADVPEDVLRQAPVSVRNRLSMTLGLKTKDIASHRISSVYYPQALSNLLKSPDITSMLLTPQAGARGTPVQTLISPMMLDGEAGFLLGQEQSPSIGFATPEANTRPVSTKDSPTAARTSARASPGPASASITRQSSLRSPAFTSHPAVMTMATAPVELPASLIITARTDSDPERPPSSSRKASQSQLSSLGEPGPEMAEGATTRSASVSEPRIILENSVITVAVVPASANEETFAAAQLKAEQAAEGHKETTQTVSQTSYNTMATLSPTSPYTQEVPQQEQDDRSIETSEKLHAAPEEEVETARLLITTTVTQTDPSYAETSLEVPVETSSSTNHTKHFIAELEAVVPGASVSKPKESFGPVELEAAPFQTFKLPPRSSATNKPSEKEGARASINQLDDFFKLPSELSIKPGMKPKDFGHSQATEPIRPLKLTLAKKDGKIVPVQVSGPIGSAARSNPKLQVKVDVVADLIEKISYTPGGSPIHARSSSSVSANSAQRLSHQSAHSLGPPAQAPAPPGPGGRSMVEPDFAAAGEFEGERKSKKKKKDSTSSRGSKSGWKAFFRQGNANRGSVSVLEKVEDWSATTPQTLTPASGDVKVSDTNHLPAADLLTNSGKDILWFKNDGKKATGMATA